VGRAISHRGWNSQSDLRQHNLATNDVICDRPEADNLAGKGPESRASLEQHVAELDEGRILGSAFEDDKSIEKQTSTDNKWIFSVSVAIKEVTLCFLPPDREADLKRLLNRLVARSSSLMDLSVPAAGDGKTNIFGDRVLLLILPPLYGHVGHDGSHHSCACT
jgi:hypothetical protein